MKGWICVESDNESGNVGEIGSLKHKESLFADKVTHESELDSGLFETSFSPGNVLLALQIEWQKNE